MQLDCVLTACNLNPLYADFIPIFIQAWTKLCPSVDIKIILVHPEIPKRFVPYAKHIICFPPIENVPTSFTSQYIRLLYPALLSCKEGVLITDIDMMPTNAMYYTRIIKQIDFRCFVSYRNPIVGGTQKSLAEIKQIAICYCVATPSTWKDIFNITCLDDIANRLKEAHGLRLGWCADQTRLYRKITNWHARTRRFIQLSDRQTGHKRLDRVDPPLNRGQLTKRVLYLVNRGRYSDYHMCRPYDKFKKINDTILHFLPTNTI